MAYDPDQDEVLDSNANGPRFPTVKLRDKGQKWVGLLIDADDQAPLYEYGITPPQRALSPEGKPKTKDVLTLLLVEGTDCVVVMPREPGEAESREEQATPGMIVRAHIQGHNRWTKDRESSFINAKRKYGNLHTCAVVTGTFESTTKIGFNGIALSQEKKILGFSVRKPNTAEEKYVERCRAERVALKEAMAMSGAGAMSESSARADELF